MVPTRQGVLVVAAAAAAVAAAVAFAAAAVARGAVKLTAADTARGAAKPTAVDDDGVDGLCRRACRERCHGLRGPVKTRRHPVGRRFAVLHLWPGHGCRRNLHYSSSSPRSEPGLPPGHRGQFLSLTKNIFFATSKSEGRPFRMRQLISSLVVLILFCPGFITNAYARAM